MKIYEFGVLQEFDTNKWLSYLTQMTDKSCMDFQFEDRANFIVIFSFFFSPLKNKETDLQDKSLIFNQNFFPIQF